ADEAEPAGTLGRTGVDLSLLQARVAENALLTLAEHLVEVDLLVRTGLDAVAVAAAALLVDQDDAVLLALVDGLAGTRLNTGRVRAVVADAGEVEVVVIGAVEGGLGPVPVRAPVQPAGLGRAPLFRAAVR